MAFRLEEKSPEVIHHPSEITITFHSTSREEFSPLGKQSKRPLRSENKRRQPDKRSALLDKTKPLSPSQEIVLITSHFRPSDLTPKVSRAQEKSLSIFRARTICAPLISTPFRDRFSPTRTDIGETQTNMPQIGTGHF